MPLYIQALKTVFQYIRHKIACNLNTGNKLFHIVEKDCRFDQIESISSYWIVRTTFHV